MRLSHERMKIREAAALLEDLEGVSPTAWVELSDGKGERLDSVYFYQNILLCESGYYKISMSEYDKLIQLCRDFSEQQ